MKSFLVFVGALFVAAFVWREGSTLSALPPQPCPEREKENPGEAGGMGESSVEVVPMPAAPLAPWKPASPFWSCPPNQDNPRRHTPMVMFTGPRSGSTFTIHLLAEIGNQLNQSDYHIVNYEEPFNNCDDCTKQRKKTMIKTIESSCQFKSEEQEQHWKWLAQMISERNRKDPQHFLGYLSALPAYSKNPYVMYKIFGEHFKATDLTPVSLINLVEAVADKDAKFFVLYRRRIIEQYVSLEIAKKLGEWHKSKTDNVKVEVKKADLEKYIEETQRFYRSVRAALEETNTQYLAFEYGRDVMNGEKHQKMIEMMLQHLNIDSSKVKISQVLQSVGLEKQANVPLSEQVLNWKEVVDWGYGGEIETWEDFF